MTGEEVCYNQSVLAAGEEVVLLLGHEERKQRSKHFRLLSVFF